MARALGLTFGVTTVCLLVVISPLCSSSHIAVYHFDGSAQELFLPVLIDVAVLWVILAGLILLGKSGRLRGTIWTGLMLMLPWVSAKEATIIAQSVVRHWLSIPLIALPFAGVIAVNIFWRRGGSALVERALPLCEVLLYFLSLTGVLVLAQLLFFFAKASGLNSPQKLHATSPATVRAAGEPKRVIILLFDELSYEQTYGNRSAQVSLPAFDRLAAESAVFRNVRPAAEYTDRAVPSILSGHAAGDIRASADGHTLEMQGRQGWIKLKGEDTVFADALREGYETGLVGWYNPYCRVIPDVLDRCDVWAHATLPNMIANDRAGAGRDLLDNSLEPLRHLILAVPKFFVPTLPEQDGDLTERHVKDYEQISQSADALLNDPAMTFVFLHLPIPHPGGIYDRHTGQMTQHNHSYLDNLALADRYLGHARQLLQARGDWDDSAVVVLGDHSWRLSLWRKSVFWADEDEAVSAGHPYDPRPAMIVKLPKNAAPANIDTVFEARRTRWLLDELMTGRIRTQAELAHWIDDQAR